MTSARQFEYPLAVQRTQHVGLLLFAAYLLAPKIPIYSFGPFSAEIRAEDFISVVALGWLVASKRLARTPLPAPVRAYLVFLGINFTSAIVNAPALGFAGFIFSLRLTQYLVWFAVGWAICRECHPERVRRAFAFIATVLIVWGLLEVAGLIPKVGRFQTTYSRISLNTGGPYEAATVALILFLVCLSPFLRAGLLLIIALAQARITMLAFAVIGFLAACRRWTFAVVGPFVVGFGLVLIAFWSTLPLGRLAETPSPPQMASTFIEAWGNSPVVADLDEFNRATEFDGDLFSYLPGMTDLSFEVRAVRWSTVVKSTISEPVSLLLGRGPSAWGIGVDGYPVRLVGEVGLLGFGAFTLFAYRVLRRYRPEVAARQTMIILLVTAAFIDIFVSSKVMPLLWFLIAAAEWSRASSERSFAYQGWIVGSRAQSVLPA